MYSSVFNFDDKTITLARTRNKHHIWTQNEKMIIYGDCVGERVFTLTEIEGSMALFNGQLLFDRVHRDIFELHKTNI